MTIGTTSPFRPAGTISVAAGTTSVAVQLSGGGESVVVTNIASSLAYVRFGSDLTVVATTSDMPVLPGSRAMLSVNSLVTTVGVILSNGSGTVLFTRGDGSFL
jgi:hypothetical protein